MGFERKRLVIDLEGISGRAWLVSGVEAGSESTFELDESAAGVASLREMASVPLDEIVLRLAPDVVLEKTLRLPTAARRKLASIVPFEIQRTLPLPADRMFYDFVAHHDGAALDVRVQVAERSQVLGAAERLAEVGVIPDRVMGGAGSGDFADLDLFDNLLPRHARPADRGATANRLLLALAVASIALAVMSPFASLEWRRLAYERAIDAAPSATTTGQSADDRARGVAQKKAAAPAITILLDDLTRLLPDDVWLTQFNWVDGQIEIEGVSRSAAALVPMIEASGKFAKVEFQTPVVRDPVAGGERFHFAITPKPPAAP